MQGDMAFEGLRATPVDVLTGAFLELSDAHGGVTFLSEIMAQHLPLLPESSSDQESMLNLMDASEMAAGVDLSSFFTSKLHWPTSDAEVISNQRDGAWLFAQTHQITVRVSRPGKS